MVVILSTQEKRHGAVSSFPGNLRRMGLRLKSIETWEKRQGAVLDSRGKSLWNYGNVGMFLLYMELWEHGEVFDYLELIVFMVARKARIPL
jgi:hypothetical protein